MLPDDNAPTVPNAQVARPDQPIPPGPPPAPRIDASGRAPIWQVVRPQVAGAAGSRSTAGSFGLGFGIALIVLALMALVLVAALNIKGKSGGLGAVATLPPTITPTQNILTPTATALPPISNDTASGLVTQFYLDISSQNFQNAYNLLSDSYQSQQTIQEFQQQWQDTQQVTVDPVTIQVTPGSDASNVYVKLTYTQVSNANPPTSTQVNATLQVGYEHNNLRILAITTQTVATTPTPEPQPSPTPEPSATPTPGGMGNGTPIPQGTPVPTGSPTK